MSGKCPLFLPCSLWTWIILKQTLLEGPFWLHVTWSWCSHLNPVIHGNMHRECVESLLRVEVQSYCSTHCSHVHIICMENTLKYQSIFCSGMLSFILMLLAGLCYHCSWYDKVVSCLPTLTTVVRWLWSNLWPCMLKIKLAADLDILSNLTNLILSHHIFTTMAI